MLKQKENGNVRGHNLNQSDHQNMASTPKKQRIYIVISI